MSCTAAVAKMLTYCDEIIRQHKTACLRVTSLLAVKDMLWVGTSAGVIVTLTVPPITLTTTKLAAPPPLAGVPHGHTGHVRWEIIIIIIIIIAIIIIIIIIATIDHDDGRFLTSVEMSPEPGGVAAHSGASRGPGLARLSAGRKEGGAGAGNYRYYPVQHIKNI